MTYANRGFAALPKTTTLQAGNKIPPLERLHSRGECRRTASAGWVLPVLRQHSTPSGRASTPHRISLRLPARLLRLPLKGGSDT